MNPALLVIAGPNGAGKTTLTARLRTDHWSEGVEYLNPDEVEARLCARTQDGHLRKVYGQLPAWVGAAVEHLPRHAAFVDLRRAG